MWTDLSAVAEQNPITQVQVLLAVIFQTISFASFAVIAFSILYLIRKQRNIPCAHAGYYFACFLIFDAAGHIVSALTHFYPVYWWYVAALLAAAVSSLATALLFIPCVPKVLAIPSPVEYEETIARLKETQREAQVSRAALEEQTLRRNLLEQEASYLREQDVHRARHNDATRRSLDRMDAMLTRIEESARINYPEMLSPPEQNVAIGDEETDA